jgi:hypothetical protein
MLTHILMFIGIAVVVFLLVVLVIQASLARLILQDIRGNNVLHQSSESSPVSGSDTLVRSYGLIVDLTTAVIALSSEHGPPPSQSGYGLCRDKDGSSHSLSLQPVTYTDTCWFPVKHSPSATRLQQDVSSGKVSTMLISNVTVKVWLATWPTADQKPIGGDILFVVSPVAGYAPVDSENYINYVVIPPLSTSSSATSWPQIKGTLTNHQGGDDPFDLPMQVWVF